MRLIFIIAMIFLFAGYVTVSCVEKPRGNIIKTCTLVIDPNGIVDLWNADSSNVTFKNNTIINTSTIHDQPKTGSKE